MKCVFPGSPNNGFAARMLKTGSYFIIGFIGKQSQIGIAPAGCQTACTRYEKPVIAVADDTDKEWRHLIIMVDTGVFFVINDDKITSDGAGCLGHKNASRLMKLNDC